MSKLSEKDRERIIQVIESGEELPIDYKHVLFPPEKKEYELVYAGKEREEDVLADTMAVPLQPVKTFGKNGDGWTNKLIFGDNLQIMKALMDDPDVQGQVKLIYIDPPFATKQEFRGSQDQKAYQDKLAGARFLEFLRKRLIFLRELLSEDGSIFVHMDYKKSHYVKALLDEILGEQNFRNEIIVKRVTKNLQRQFETIENLPQGHDVLYWYTKQSSTRFKLPLTAREEFNEEGYWKDFWSNADRPTMRYPLLGVTPARGQWKWKKERAEKAVNNYHQYLKESKGKSLVEFWQENDGAMGFIRKSPTGKIEHWIAPDKMKFLDTLWMDVSAYQSKKEYPTQKNEQLLNRIVENFSKRGDLVMDCFAGSGTTLAVAEKLDRRWIGVDCGKLAIYTMQKRMLNLQKEIGNRGRSLKPKPFTLYTAGLYDFKQLKKLPWEEWRKFALVLFNCRDNKHKVGGIQLDGFRGRSDVLVFNHLQDPDLVLDYGFIDDLHSMVGSKVSREFFIIVPAARIMFLEDYLDKGSSRYYILRIPYSIINELHNRNFEAIKQPIDETQVNDTVDAVGFDFIRPPKVECEYSIKKTESDDLDVASIKIKTFKSEAMLKGASQIANRESLSMVMVDFNYNGDTFNLEKVFYASEIEKNDWQIHLPVESFKNKIMIIYLDIYGNEYREIKTKDDFIRLKKGKINA
jgi:site-specific DNA-methyltransferase (adenine-specific)/adenine-specific DNA-methyltransferase